MENQFATNLEKFFEKHGSVGVKRFVCYFYLGMLRFRGHEELQNEAMNMVIQAVREIELIAMKIDEDNQNGFRSEAYPLLQQTLAFMRLSEEKANEISEYCHQQIIPTEESLEKYLKLKLAANDYLITFFKNCPTDLINAATVVAMVRGNYAERFTLFTRMELTEAQVSEFIKPFYTAKGYRITTDENRFLVFENDDDCFSVIFSVYESMVQVTVSNMP